MNQLELLNLAVLIFIIGLVSVLFYSTTDYPESGKTPESSADYQSTLLEVDQFLNLISDAQNKYFRYSYKEELKNRYKPLSNQISIIRNRKFSTNPQVIQFKEVYANLDSNVRTWNEAYCANEIAAHEDLFDNIDGKSLDMAQRKAVVVDEDNTLVVAGAGTGKTLTVSAKVKYLVDKKNVNPAHILLISYTRKAAAEMQERISGRLGIDVDAKTFHSLGLNIITRGLGNQPDVLDPNKGEMENLINKYFEDEVLVDPEVMKNLIEFFAYYLNIPQDLDKVNNLGEVYEDYRGLDFETFKSKVDLKITNLKTKKITIPGERVRSLEEATIANFLYLHGVKYTYEKTYPYDTGDPYRKTYKPDFYLEDYDIYLEHFGINEHGRTPWLSSIEEKKYLDGMRWKREIHRSKYTTLIETYSYQNKYGQLNVALDQLLQSKGVKYQEVDLREIYEKVFTEKENRYFKEFKKLLKTFISLFKSNGYSATDFVTLYNKIAQEKSDFLRKRSNLFLTIVQPVYLLYQEYLEETGQIDFNDMINQATETVQLGRVTSDYKYIIVDEYQDISVSRYRLINELKKQTNAQIVAVGDDWQSIYRFAGSDINLFTDIDKYFGYTEKVKIEKTYRNSQELISLAGSFIMKNPKQIRKQLSSDMHNNTPIIPICYNEDAGGHLRSIIFEIVNNFGAKSEILILGRTNYDIDIFDGQDGFRIITKDADRIIKSDQYPDLPIKFMTVHRAKGLESENVIVLNLENSLLGFPNKIADDPVLSIVLADEDEYEFAEERRLFYVALTRTKNRVYLLADGNNPSIFVDELRREQSIPYYTFGGETVIWNNPACPRCKKGVLILRTNRVDGSQFSGCSNYPQCDYKVNDIKILNYFSVCLYCGGFMVKKGDGFSGCTNYPYCTHTIRNNVSYLDNKVVKIDKDIPF